MQKFHLKQKDKDRKNYGKTVIAMSKNVWQIEHT